MSESETDRNTREFRQGWSWPRRLVILGAVVVALIIAFVLLITPYHIAGNFFGSANPASADAKKTVPAFRVGGREFSVDKLAMHGVSGQRLHQLVTGLAHAGITTIDSLVEVRGYNPSRGHWNNQWLRIVPAAEWYNTHHPNATPVQVDFTMAFVPSWMTDVPDQVCSGTRLCAPAFNHMTAFGQAGLHAVQYAHAHGVAAGVWVGQQSNIAKLFIGGSPSVLSAMVNATHAALRGTGAPTAIGELAPSGDQGGNLSASTYVKMMLKHRLNAANVSQVILMTQGSLNNTDMIWQGEKINFLPDMGGKPIGVVFHTGSLNTLKTNVSIWRNNTYKTGTIGVYWDGRIVAFVRHHPNNLRSAFRGK